MSRALPIRISLSILALSLTVIACQKSEQKDADPVKPASTADLSFTQKTAEAEVTLVFPESFKPFADLHETLAAEDKASLNVFIAQAHKDHAALLKGGFEQPAYFRNIIWHLTAETKTLVSAYSEITEYAGGAHGNLVYHTVLWDKATDAPLEADKLFAPDADLKPVETYLCRQVEAERSKRSEIPITQANSGFGCPKMSQAKLILIPSKTAGKAGAMDVLFAPYEVGPYAEGTYQIRLPLNVIKDTLALAYAGEFGGDPASIAPINH